MSSSDSGSTLQDIVFRRALEFEHVQLQAAYVLGYSFGHSLDPRVLHSLLFAGQIHFWNANDGGMELIWRGQEEGYRGSLDIYLCSGGNYALRCLPASSSRNLLWLWGNARGDWNEEFDCGYINGERRPIAFTAVHSCEVVWEAIAYFYLNGTASTEHTWLLESEFEEKYGFPVIDYYGKFSE